MKSLVNLITLCVALLLSSQSSSGFAGQVTGTLYKWHPITIDFNGPVASETDHNPNPFLDYRLTVELTGPNGTLTRVPGFFAGNGQGDARGDIWRIRFSADQVGRWTYRARLHQGAEVAVNLDPNSGQEIQLPNSEGEFFVSAASESAPEFLRHGRLEYVGGHYLKFRDGPYWIKGGTDSPENLLGYAGIDGTVDQGGIYSNFLHTFENHRGDWQDGDPLFANSSTGADSRGLIGALNYLSDRGVNSVYFLPMNLGGDGQETYPFIGANNNRYDKTRYDISKLFQWNTVLNHAQEKGIALNIVLSETEPENERWLDNGQMGVERKLYFRELIARFGYLLAIKWNLGEENDFPAVELNKHADFINALDWSGKPIAVHTHINQFYRYTEIVGDPRYQASSIQYDAEFAGEFVELWRRNSAESGHPWVVDMDENTNGLAPSNVGIRRKQILYDVLFSGGHIEWYFGYHPLPPGGDVDAGDFRERDEMWRQMHYARLMMQSELPFWQMEPSDDLVRGDNDTFGGAEVFALAGEAYAVYLPASNGAESINLSGYGGDYRSRWFDPRSGQMHEESVVSIVDGWFSLGGPPNAVGDDWVWLLTKATATAPTPPENPINQDLPRFVELSDQQVSVGSVNEWRFIATDADGTYPSVTVGKIPPGMRVDGPGNGQLVLSWIVPDTALGTHTVELIAIDALDSTRRNLQTITIVVTESNGAQTPPEDTNNPPVSDEAHGPIFRTIPQQTVIAGEILAITVVADDPDGIPPALNVLNPPNGSSFEDNGNGTRTFYWQTSEVDIGNRTLSFVAKDHANSKLSDRLDVEIQITNP